MIKDIRLHCFSWKRRGGHTRRATGRDTSNVVPCPKPLLNEILPVDI